MKEPLTTNNEVSVHKNKLTFEEQVIKKIAGISANDIDGILSMSGGFMSGIADRFRASGDITKGVDVEFGEKEVAIDLKVIVEYGKSIPAIFEETIAQVKKSMFNMTGLEVVELNMHVEDVMTRAEFEETTKLEEKNISPTGEVTRTLG